ncbi:hypothetical protein HK104_007744 [Borealophlyctis nickersoniae]|nr:hypothetical protein HK104_007744 [Borealophlyctis nickersoniae]
MSRKLTSKSLDSFLKRTQKETAADKPLTVATTKGKKTILNRASYKRRATLEMKKAAAAAAAAKPKGVGKLNEGVETAATSEAAAAERLKRNLAYFNKLKSSSKEKAIKKKVACSLTLLHRTTQALSDMS